MKNSVDIKRGYQAFYMLRRAAFAVFVCIIVQIVVFINFFDEKVLRTIIGCVMALVYAAVLYTGAAVLGKFDAKPYTPLKVQLWRPLIWGGIIVTINIVFLIMYKINWAVMPQGEELPTLVSVIINGAFYIWNSPFIAFIYGNVNGYISNITILLMVIVPLIACFLGYFAGSKNLFIMVKFNDFMFEKKDSEE